MANVPEIRKLLAVVEEHRDKFDMGSWIKVLPTEEEGIVEYHLAPWSPQVRQRFIQVGEVHNVLMKEGACNTTACLAGWVATCDPEVREFSQNLGDQVIMQDGTRESIVTYAGKKLGLDEEEARDIFFTTDDHCNSCMDDTDYCDNTVCDGQDITTAEDLALDKLRAYLPENARG